MLYAHPKVLPDPARIRFTEFGDFSLNLDVFAYVDVTDYGAFLEIAEDLNLRIMDIVSASGSRSAIPSQALYVPKGSPMDKTKLVPRKIPCGNGEIKTRYFFQDFRMKKLRSLGEPWTSRPTDHRMQ